MRFFNPMKKKYICFLLLVIAGDLFSQKDTVPPNDTGKVSKKSQKLDVHNPSAADRLRAGTTVTALIIGNDTVPVINLPAFRVMDVRNFKNKKEEKNYYRLKRDVMKVYPYARLAGDKLRIYNDSLEKIPTERMRKKYLKKIEQELKEEFTDDLENMGVNQGRILIRLIDRETGNTSYHMIEELRGAFSAFFWQSIARIFGHNLKSRYNPKEGEDKLIEEIVLLIESGDYK